MDRGKVNPVRSGVPGGQALLPRIGVILTLADLYRKSRPELPGQFGALWRTRVEAVMQGIAEPFFPSVTHTPEEFDSAVRECEAQNCTAVAVWPMAYAASGTVLPAARRTRLPLIVVSTARDATLPYDMTGDHMLANQAVHGAIDLTNALRRAGRAYHLVAGHDSSSSFAEDLRKAVVAACAAWVLRHARVGQIGSFFEGMLDFTFDPQLQSEQLGFTTIAITPESLIDKAATMKRSFLAIEAERLSAMYEMDPSFTDDEIDSSLRFSCALEEIVQENDLNAIAMNFLPVLHAGATSLPFLGAARLMKAGIGYAGEGDVLGAVLTAAMARIADQATFTEIYAPDYERGEVLLSHMGECNTGMADPNKPIRVVARPFPWGKCQRTAVPVFQMRPGIVTLASLSQSGDHGFQLLVLHGEIIAAPPHINLCSPYSRICFGPDLAQFIRSYSVKGGTHHLALVHGDLRCELEAMAHMMGVEFAVLES